MSDEFVTVSRGDAPFVKVGNREQDVKSVEGKLLSIGLSQFSTPDKPQREYLLQLPDGKGKVILADNASLSVVQEGHVGDFIRAEYAGEMTSKTGRTYKRINVSILRAEGASPSYLARYETPDVSDEEADDLPF